MKDSERLKARDKAIRDKQQTAGEQRAPLWEREEQYQAAIYSLVGFVWPDEATFAQEWAARFCEVGPLLTDRNMDFALQDWIKQAGIDNADQEYCLALELFLLACKGDKRAISGVLKRALEHKPDPYLGELRNQMCGVRSRLLEPMDELPWTPAFKDRAAFARAVEGLAGLSYKNIPRWVEEGKLFEETSDLGGSRFPC